MAENESRNRRPLKVEVNNGGMQISSEAGVTFESLKTTPEGMGLRAGVDPSDPQTMHGEVRITNPGEPRMRRSRQSPRKP